MPDKGNCKHGEFILTEGCPQCIAARREAGIMPEQDEMEDGLNNEGLTMVGTSLLTLRPGEDVEVRSHYTEALRLLEYAESRVIATVEDTKIANNDLAVISKLKKAMEAKRKEYLQPLKGQTEAIRDTYNYLMAPVLEADKITRDKMLAFNKEQERIRREQEEINRKRLEAAEAEMRLNGELTESVNLVEVTPEPAKRVSTEMGTSGQRDNWQCEVVDINALPREYMMPDLVLLNAIAKKYHDKKEVVGVRFYNKPIISVRAR